MPPPLTHSLHYQAPDPGQALTCFLEQMSEPITAPFVKPVTTAFLPPNLALLSACREVVLV